MYCFTYYLNFVSTLYSSGYFEYVLLIVFVIFLLEFILYASVSFLHQQGPLFNHFTLNVETERTSARRKCSLNIYCDITQTIPASGLSSSARVLLRRVTPVTTVHSEGNKNNFHSTCLAGRRETLD
jgi:hypothetical protein